MGPGTPYMEDVVFREDVEGPLSHDVYWEEVGLSEPVMSGNRAMALAGWSIKGLFESSGGGEPYECCEEYMAASWQRCRHEEFC